MNCNTIPDVCTKECLHSLPCYMESCQIKGCLDVCTSHSCDACIEYAHCVLCEDVCKDSCEYSKDGQCDDGGEGSEYNECKFGTDCFDCGMRLSNCSIVHKSKVYPPPPKPDRPPLPLLPFYKPSPLPPSSPCQKFMPFMPPSPHSPSKTPVEVHEIIVQSETPNASTGMIILATLFVFSLLFWGRRYHRKTVSGVMIEPLNNLQQSDPL